jgi:phosphohistidine phosphatase
VKTLLVMRHAKSDRSNPGLPDHDRPLGKRGRADAARIATWLQVRQLEPDHVSCSTARRTRDTVDLLAPALGRAQPCFADTLYLANAHELLDHVRGLPDGSVRALLVGHNPGLQQLVLHLLPRSPARRPLEEGFPTAAVAVLALPITAWSEARAGAAELVASVTPRLLR